MKVNVRRQRPSEPVLCTLWFPTNQVQHLDTHEPANNPDKQLTAAPRQTLTAMSMPNSALP